jgi:hypothetical protein
MTLILNVNPASDTPEFGSFSLTNGQKVVAHKDAALQVERIRGIFKNNPGSDLQKLMCEALSSFETGSPLESLSVFVLFATSEFPLVNMPSLVPVNNQTHYQNVKVSTELLTVAEKICGFILAHRLGQDFDDYKMCVAEAQIASIREKYNNHEAILSEFQGSMNRACSTQDEVELVARFLRPDYVAEEVLH